MMLRDRRVQLGAVIALVVLVVAGAVWLSKGGHNAAGTAGAGPVALSSADNRARDAADVAQVLEALPRDPQAAVAKSSSSLITDARAAISANAIVVAHPETWQPDGVGGGVMAATIKEPGRPDANYLVVMVREPDGWKVAATVRVAASPTRTG